MRIENLIVNTDNLVDAEIVEGDTSRVEVVLTTTGLRREPDGALAPRTHLLEGAAAELFLASLPVYAPVLGEEGGR